MPVTTTVDERGVVAERDLVDRHRHGDPEAFTEVYERFSGLVYNLALRLSGNPDRAQDLSQEVFLRIFRSLARFRGRSSLKTWIYRICLNHCRSRLGRRRVFTESLGARDETAVDVADPSRGPEDLAMAAEAARVLSGALPQLAPVFREAVALRDLEGLSYHEIAQVLGVRIGTVRSRIARGRDQLRRILDVEGENDGHE